MSDIEFHEHYGASGKIGEVVLNRPEKLNALSQDMCFQLQEKLLLWRHDDDLNCVMIRGEGDRAFCAGGDIRFMYDNGVQKAKLSDEFFGVEYALNKLIFHFPKPYISFLHGITMGGAAGISFHGMFRIGAQDFRFAMPEAGIGFFPDVGAGYFLTRCPNDIGRYLGLTGAFIQRSDALALGFLTHCINKENWLTIREEIIALEEVTENSIRRVLSRFVVQSEAFEVFMQKGVIQTAFSAHTVEEIFSRLEQDPNPFAKKTLDILQQKSPLSLKVILEQLKRASSMSFDEINEMEYRIACSFTRTPDFMEGIRAAIVDKDRKPKWAAQSLKDVTASQVQGFFD